MIWIPFAGMVSVSALAALNARWYYRQRWVLEGVCYTLVGLFVFLIAVWYAKIGGLLWLP